METDAAQLRSRRANEFPGLRDGNGGAAATGRLCYRAAANYMSLMSQNQLIGEVPSSI